MVTIAPEIDGGLDAIRQIVEAGAVAAIGHTDATYDQTRAGPGRGRHRGHPPVQRHAPGPPPRTRPDHRAARGPAGRIELIADGVHLHPAALGTPRERRTRPYDPRHRRDGRGRCARRRLPPRLPRRAGHRRGGAAQPRRGHRRQHPDHGRRVPTRRPHRRDVGARRGPGCLHHPRRKRSGFPAWAFCAPVPAPISSFSTRRCSW